MKDMKGNLPFLTAVFLFLMFLLSNPLHLIPLIPFNLVIP